MEEGKNLNKTEASSFYQMDDIDKFSPSPYLQKEILITDEDQSGMNRAREEIIFQMQQHNKQKQRSHTSFKRLHTVEESPPSKDPYQIDHHMTLGPADSASSKKSVKESKKSFTERVQLIQRTRTATETRKRINHCDEQDYAIQPTAQSQTGMTTGEARSNIDFIEMISCGTGTVADASISQLPVTIS